MSFLLDTDICSIHVKRSSCFGHRFVQHQGRLYVSTIVVAELLTWAHSKDDPAPLRHAIDELLGCFCVLPFDLDCAQTFGRLRGQLLRSGVSVARMDLLIASVALCYDLTLVTRNIRDYSRIPGLRLDDWNG